MYPAAEKVFWHIAPEWTRTPIIEFVITLEKSVATGGLNTFNRLYTVNLVEQKFFKGVSTSLVNTDNLLQKSVQKTIIK